MWVLPCALFSPVCEDTLAPPPDIVGMSGAILTVFERSVHCHHPILNRAPDPKVRVPSGLHLLYSRAPEVTPGF